jgi:formylglycine-generating enzyme required for sulfatase activity
MSGNVWEWCFDAFSDEKGVEKRVVRGGGWIGTPYRLQIGGEFGSKPEILEQAQGFRVAKSGW